VTPRGTFVNSITPVWRVCEEFWPSQLHSPTACLGGGGYVLAQPWSATLRDRVARSRSQFHSFTVHFLRVSKAPKLLKMGEIRAATMHKMARFGALFCVQWRTLACFCAWLCGLFGTKADTLCGGVKALPYSSSSGGAKFHARLLATFAINAAMSDAMKQLLFPRSEITRAPFFNGIPI
jgi:hypothetical protein